MVTILCRCFRGCPSGCRSSVALTGYTAIRKFSASPSCWKPREESSIHHLRSHYSVIRHHYKESGSTQEAINFVNHFGKLKNVRKTQLHDTMKLLKKDGYCWQEVKLFKEVLLLKPSEYSERVLLLHDLSISSPSVHHLLEIAKLMDISVDGLKESTSTFKSNPFEQLLSAGRQYLKLPESTLHSARRLYVNDGQITLKEVYYFILKHYLSSRFSVEPAAVDYLLSNFRSSSRWKPFHHFSRICDFLIDSLRFSFTEVQEQPSLLFVDPNNAAKIMEMYPSIGGNPTAVLAITHPKLLDIPASHLDSWMRLLQKYQVVQFTYTYQATHLFNTSSFFEVEKILQALTKLTDWEVIVASDKLIDILRSRKYAKRLLNAMESGQTFSSFSSIFQGSELRHKQWHGITSEIVSYFSSTLSIPIEQTRELLAEYIYTTFGISNIKTVLRLLLDYGFTREQIVAAPMVLNFEAGVVEQVLRELHNRPEAQPFVEWMENPFVLHLLAYCIKKDIPHLEMPVKRVKLDAGSHSALAALRDTKLTVQEVDLKDTH